MTTEDRTTTTAVFQDTTKLQDTPFSTASSANSVDLPVYASALLIVGGSLIVTTAILLVAVSIGGWISKRAKRNKVLPEFSTAKIASYS